ncbi:TRAP transporter substrate-binding protein [Ramlibacter sp.]|uniref:TRAP transporter substrate-binding protein n=1 Tax=Ramlibacter sp. TaxID=1917967 RepID=UPI00182C0B75|nr:TRAP transporter substrate-binding protein [Ramlibacter sp.]MBA2674292.1 TRAP transporter substrate-binding protein [Ramlibacter sp.]
MGLKRRTLLAAAGACTLAGPALAQKSAPGKADFKLRFANNLPPSHPLNQRAREMALAVRNDTQGRLEIEIFPNSELGPDTEMISQLRSGTIDFFTLSGLILSSQVPAAAITGLGFAFPNYDTVWSAVDGDLGAYIRAEIAAKGDLLAMDNIWDNGFRQITSSARPIQSAADLRNMKLRVPVSPMWTSMFKALDAVPASLNFSEVYRALEARTVDGQENPLAVIDSAKLYEVQKYCSLTYHMWDGFWFLANRASWMRLPEDMRSILARRINAAATAQRTDVAILNATLLKVLKEKGMVFNQPDPESFRKRIRQAGFYTDWKARFGDKAWALLERSTGGLA